MVHEEIICILLEHARSRYRASNRVKSIFLDALNNNVESVLALLERADDAIRKADA